MNVDGSVCLGVVISDGSRFGRGVGGVVDSVVGDEVGEGVELEVGSIVLLIKMSNMKSM